MCIVEPTVTSSNASKEQVHRFTGRGIIRTTVIGSWPKPAWLFRGLPSHSGDGKGVSSGFTDCTAEAKDRATQEAIDDQIVGKLDAVSDGEQRRENYIFYHIQRGFGGVDFDKRSEHVQRGGSERTMAPTITGPIVERESGFLVDDYLKAKAAAPQGTNVIVTIPGPMTIIDTIHDDFYFDDEKLADDIVKVLRSEAERLVAAGVSYISVDEPVYVRYPEKVLKWGIRTLDDLLNGLDCFRAVHICCSYPTCPCKADSTLYAAISPMLAASSIHAVSLEHANKPIDLERVLTPLSNAGKAVILGVCGTSEDVETVELLKHRATEALKYIAPAQLILAPDCGLVCTSRASAMQKVRNLGQAALELNASLHNWEQAAEY